MNRKQRRTTRQQQQQQGQKDRGNENSDRSSADDIPLARADFEGRDKKVKTLFEIAAERQASLQLPGSKGVDFGGVANGTVGSGKNVVQVRIGEDGKIVPLDENGKDEVIAVMAGEGEVSPWLDTLFLATSLSALHFTLEVLTMHQYAQQLEFRPLIFNTVLRAWPTLVLLIHLFHGHFFPRTLVKQRFLQGETFKGLLRMLRQTIFLGIANVAGCYLIQLTNDRGYYAIMKRAPGIGTLWVWAVLEMGLVGALAGVVGPGLFAWWFGYEVV